MAGDRGPQVWGLWNTRMSEWFNPGTVRPYFPTREAAMRMVPLAMRQYPFGKWEPRPYPLVRDDVDEDENGGQESEGRLTASAA